MVKSCYIHFSVDNQCSIYPRWQSRCNYSLASDQISGTKGSYEWNHSCLSHTDCRKSDKPRSGTIGHSTDIEAILGRIQYFGTSAKSLLGLLKRAIIPVKTFETKRLLDSCTFRGV